MKHVPSGSRVRSAETRKAAADPDAGFLARFVSAECRHSTWIDHPFIDEIFGAGHAAIDPTGFDRDQPAATTPTALTTAFER